MANNDEASRAINRRVEAKIGKGGYYDIDIVNKRNKSRTVALEKAKETDFTGYFLITDKNRSYEQYHAVFVLYPNKQIFYSEYGNGKPIQMSSQDAFWDFNNKSLEFLFDATNQGKYPNSGVLKGKITGNTNAFDMNGKWSSGDAAQTRFYRISKDEFCV